MLLKKVRIRKALSEEQLSWNIEKAMQKTKQQPVLYSSPIRINFENLWLSSKSFFKSSFQ